MFLLREIHKGHAKLTLLGKQRLVASPQAFSRSLIGFLQRIGLRLRADFSARAEMVALSGSPAIHLAGVCPTNLLL
jgi:hypothetical protein